MTMYQESERHDSDEREPCACARACVQKQYLGSHLGARTYCKFSRQMRLMAFARQHDWGKEAIANEDGSITVSTWVSHKPALLSLATPDGHIETKTFSKMDELRKWAGY